MDLRFPSYTQHYIHTNSRQPKLCYLGANVLGKQPRNAEQGRQGRCQQHVWKNNWTLHEESDLREWYIYSYVCEHDWYILGTNAYTSLVSKCSSSSLSVCKYLGKGSDGSYMHVWSSFRHSTPEFTKEVTALDNCDPNDVQAERKQLQVLILACLIKQIVHLFLWMWNLKNN